MNAPRQKSRGGPMPFPEQMERMFDRFARGPGVAYGGSYACAAENGRLTSMFRTGEHDRRPCRLAGHQESDFDISIEGNTPA
jgi:hypothetical protein